ncbi:phosphatases II [Rhizoclosmatium globosum]|uniref:protein-tyrosine-phosphatase n=1 Tax=Rhizoclosmatium globosum TaxID=329046 RepID=A0A1Y2CTV6_9FUNG|nr:phosphatases II [Rhizoclosmatium globosum]|eukprot:ORY50397.1 phosphatases II [Rhizoclosmatium globosum]
MSPPRLTLDCMPQVKPLSSNLFHLPLSTPLPRCSANEIETLLEQDPYTLIGGPIQILEEGLLISSRAYAESCDTLQQYNIGLVVNVASEVQNALLEEVPSYEFPLPAQFHRHNSASTFSSSCSSGESVCQTPAMSPRSFRCISPSTSFNQIDDVSSTSMSTSTSTPTTPHVKPEYIKLDWGHDSDISTSLPQVLQQINSFLDTNPGGKQVLVACNQGVSRSASLVIACVMSRRGLGLSEAYDFVKTRNELISPNVGLLGQLAQLHSSGVLSISSH